MSSRDGRGRRTAAVLLCLLAGCGASAPAREAAAPTETAAVPVATPSTTSTATPASTPTATPEPTPTPTPTPTPKPKPKPIAAPCDLLTADDVAEFPVAPDPDQPPYGCRYKDDGGALVFLTMTTRERLREQGITATVEAAFEAGRNLCTPQTGMKLVDGDVGDRSLVCFGDPGGQGVATVSWLQRRAQFAVIVGNLPGQDGTGARRVATDLAETVSGRL